MRAIRANSRSPSAPWFRQPQSELHHETPRGFYVAPPPLPGQKSRSDRSDRDSEYDDRTHLGFGLDDGLAVLVGAARNRGQGRARQSSWRAREARPGISPRSAAGDETARRSRFIRFDHGRSAACDSARPAGGSSERPQAPTGATQPRRSSSESDDWLSFKTPSQSGSTQTGFSTPWQPAKRPGGGKAALQGARRVQVVPVALEAGNPRRDHAAHASAFNTVRPHRHGLCSAIAFTSGRRTPPPATAPTPSGGKQAKRSRLAGR